MALPAALNVIVQIGSKVVRMPAEPRDDWPAVVGRVSLEPRARHAEVGRRLGAAQEVVTSLHRALPSTVA